jgi:branched-chain amino acid transport system permease protein
MKFGRNRALVIIFILVALAFPLVADVSSIAVEVLLLTGAAAAWNIFSGYTGYISLGQAAFYGLGGYTLTLASQDWHLQGDYSLFLLLPLAGLAASAFSIPLGWIALRTQRYTFMVITIAFFFIFQLLAYNLGGITGGSSGIFLPSPSWSADLANIPFYYVALALVLLIVLVSWRLRYTQYGLVLLAIRDDEDRVRSLGHRIEWHKLGVYALSAFFIGMIGALAAYFSGYINPSSAFDQTLDITIVTMTFFGGIGSIWGPVVGGLLLEPLQAYLTEQFSATAVGLNQILFGCLLLLVILLFPQGIVPSLHKRWLAWRASRIEVDSRLATLAALTNSLALSLANGTSMSQMQAPTVTNRQNTSPIPVASIQAVLSTPECPIEQFEPLSTLPEQVVPSIPEHSTEQFTERPIEQLEPLSALPEQVVPHISEHPTEQLVERPVEQFEPVYTRSEPVVPSIPERPIEQFELLYMPGSLKPQRMRASRLVPMRSNDPVHVPEQSIPPSPVSWRCPKCRVPFLLNGDICYCRRCGLTRSLSSLTG